MYPSSTLVCPFKLLFAKLAADLASAAAKSSTEEKGDAWKRTAGSKALAMTRKACKDNNLQPEGRVALLKRGLQKAKEIDPPNWGDNPEKRQKHYATLESYIKACDNVLAAPTIDRVRDIVAVQVKQQHLYSNIKTEKHAAKVLKQITQHRLWELSIVAAKSTEAEGAKSEK